MPEHHRSSVYAPVEPGETRNLDSGAQRSGGPGVPAMAGQRDLRHRMAARTRYYGRGRPAQVYTRDDLAPQTSDSEVDWEVSEGPLSEPPFPQAHDEPAAIGGREAQKIYWDGDRNRSAGSFRMTNHHGMILIATVLALVITGTAFVTLMITARSDFSQTIVARQPVPGADVASLNDRFQVALPSTPLQNQLLDSIRNRAQESVQGDNAAVIANAGVSVQAMTPQSEQWLTLDRIAQNHQGRSTGSPVPGGEPEPAVSPLAYSANAIGQETRGGSAVAAVDLVDQAAPVREADAAGKINAPVSAPPQALEAEPAVIATDPVKLPPEPKPAVPASATQKRVTAYVNMRSRSSNKAKIITVVPAKARVNVVDCSRFWCEVVYSGERGFVAKKFIRDVS